MGSYLPRRCCSCFQAHGSRTSLIAALLAAVAPLCAQTAPPAAAQTLPNAPLTSCPTTVSGSVVDSDGDEIPFAKVSLAPNTPDPPVEVHQMSVGEDGLFELPGSAGGPCTVRVTADGFLAKSVPVTSASLTIQLVASDSADVTVTTSQEEMAEAQIHLEEHQMIAGFVPNFYVAYDYHAAPLNKRQKFQLAYKTLINPFTNLINAGVAGLEQADNALPGYGQGTDGYLKRFGAQTADTAIATELSGALLPILFHQDPRYFYMGKGTITHRALYALATSVIARGDNGKWQPAYASILGDFSAGAISNLYYPKSNRSDGIVTLSNGLISTGLDGVGNLVQEFVFKHLTPHAPVSP